MGDDSEIGSVSDVGESSGVADAIGVGEGTNVGDGASVAEASGVGEASGISIGVGESSGIGDGSMILPDPSVDGTLSIVSPLLLGAAGVPADGPGMTITRGVGTVEAKSKFRTLGSLLNLPKGCQPPLRSP